MPYLFKLKGTKADVLRMINSDESEEFWLLYDIIGRDYLYFLTEIEDLRNRLNDLFEGKYIKKEEWQILREEYRKADIIETTGNRRLPVS